MHPNLSSPRDGGSLPLCSATMTYTNVIGTFVCLASNQMEYLVFSPVTASIPVRIAPQPVAPPVAASSLDLRPEVASRALESFARAFADICVGLVNLT